MTERSSEVSRDGWYPGKYIRKSLLSPSSTTRDSNTGGDTLPSSSMSFYSSTSVATPSVMSQQTKLETSEPTTDKTKMDAQPMNHQRKESFYHHFKPAWKGIIKKQGHRVRNWKSRFFVISGCMMLYYYSEEDYLNPEKCQKPLGYHIITSIAPSGKSMSNANALIASNATNSTTSITISKVLSKDMEYVLETLEEKTFYLKFSQSCGFFSAAQGAISIYLTEYQDAMDSQLKLAICLSHNGCIELAIQLLQSLAYGANPSTEALFHLGTAYLVNNDFDDAVVAFQACLDVKSDHIQALINLATTFYCTNDMEHAKSLYESALGLEPSNIEAANNLALLYAQCGTKDELELAEFKIKYAITCSREDPRLYLTYAEILMSVNDIERAIDILFQGLKDVPTQESSDLNMKIGELLFLKNAEKSEAIEYFQEAIGIDPRNLKARELLEEALLAREDIISAQEDEFFAKERSREGQNMHSNIVSSMLKHTKDNSESSGTNEDQRACFLQGMLEKKHTNSEAWHEMYFELSDDYLRWFLSGKEFTQSKVSGDDNDKNTKNVTKLEVSNMSSISKVSGSMFQFMIKMSNGDMHYFKTNSEHDTKVWLDALQNQTSKYKGVTKS